MHLLWDKGNRNVKSKNKLWNKKTITLNDLIRIRSTKRKLNVTKIIT